MEYQKKANSGDSRLRRGVEVFDLSTLGGYRGYWLRAFQAGVIDIGGPWLSLIAQFVMREL